MSTPPRFPFGTPLREVVQQDRRPKRVFVLGVYASAVHARWLSPDGKERVRALAVASEPYIFWRGEGAGEIVGGIELPPGAGSLEAADDTHNGPSGRALDRHVLGPLGLGRDDAWLCDLVPHACLNGGQRAAIAREYAPRQAELGLPAVSVPAVPPRFADDERRTAVWRELEESGAEVVVLLGDQPVRHWLRGYSNRWRRLGDFGANEGSYGRLHEVDLGGRTCRVLPLVHPRQAAGLGRHSPRWRALHAAWAERVAPGLLA